jgi:hypothetical protein
VAARAFPLAREKEDDKDSTYPYPELTQVSQGEKPKACSVKDGEGNRQIRPVTSG